MHQTSKTSLPLFVSHRGNTHGPVSGYRENSRDALSAAIESGFEWVEVDVQLTRDGVPVLHHDATINADDKILHISRLTLLELRDSLQNQTLLTLEDALQEFGSKINFLIEAKSQGHISQLLVMAREIAKLAYQHRDQTKIIIDSFQWELVSSVASQCSTCETAIDAPYKQAVSVEWLQSAKATGFDWVYVEKEVISEDFIENAHQAGLKVMAYTVNDTEVLMSWSGFMPDGIITDDYRIVKRSGEYAKD